MSIESEDDLRGLLEIGRIVGMTLNHMHNAIRPGITTGELDDIGAAFLSRHHARPAPPLVYNYPGATCISVNDEVAHGIPGKRVIRAGDLVNIDVSAELNGFFADTGASFPVPPVSPDTRFLCERTQDALHAAINAVRAGERLNVIGRAVESVANRANLTIIRQLQGHGVGRSLHEEPRNIPSYFSRSASQHLTEGMVLTIEPFLTFGRGSIYKAQDGWTLKTTDGKRAAQYEHTIIITKDKPILITAV